MDFFPATLYHGIGYLVPIRNELQGVSPKQDQGISSIIAHSEFSKLHDLSFFPFGLASIALDNQQISIFSVGDAFVSELDVRL